MPETPSPSPLPQLIDVEDALRTLARFRRRRDDATVIVGQMADTIAANLARHFGPEALETAGIALVLGAASVGNVATQCTDHVAQAVANMIGLAGQRLVLDARAADDG